MLLVAISFILVPGRTVVEEHVLYRFHRLRTFFATSINFRFCISLSPPAQFVFRSKFYKTESKIIQHDQSINLSYLPNPPCVYHLASARCRWLARPKTTWYSCSRKTLNRSTHIMTDREYQINSTTFFAMHNDIDEEMQFNIS